MSLRKKHNDGKIYEVFPLEVTRAQLGDSACYDRNTRGRSWVIIDLALPAGKFIPRGSTGFITADGKVLTVGRNRV